MASRYQFIVAVSAAITWPAQRQEVLAVEDRGDGDDDHDHRDLGGDQPADAPGPEAAQLDAVAPLVLAEQQERDQEPAEDEEHVDAEEPTGHPRDVAVVQEDADDGEGADAVETRDAALHRTLRSCGGRRSARSGSPARPWRPLLCLPGVVVTIWGYGGVGSLVAKPPAARDRDEGRPSLARSWCDEPDILRGPPGRVRSCRPDSGRRRSGVPISPVGTLAKHVPEPVDRRRLTRDKCPGQAV